MTIPPHAAANTDPQAHRELQALKAWRDEAERTRRLPPRVITDAQLTEIVMRARKHIPAVQNALHSSVRQFAEEIIQVQQAASGTSGPAGPSGPAGGSAARNRPGPSQPTAATPPTSDSCPGAPDPVRLRELEQRFARVSALPARAPKLGVVRPVPVADGIRLRWPGPTEREPIMFHRVVSRDDVLPYSPEGCALIDILDHLPADQSLVATDTREPRAAVRFFAVFEHRGRSADEAFEDPPTLVAAGTFVFGIGDQEIREEDGLVIGRWTTRPGVSQVLVYRIPIDQLAMGAGQDPSFLLDTGDPHLGGFVDHDAVPGQRYRYDMVVEVVRGDGTLLSDPISAEVAISAPLVAITDLVVDKRYAEDGSARFDVSWSKPTAGQVLLYRTEKGPVAGATNDVHAVDVLGQLGMRDDDQQRMPVVVTAPGREGMRDLRGKAGWSRIHFTPVTSLNGQIRVGETRTLLVIGEPTQPGIVERCDHQVLKFGWPAGAAKVIVAPRGTDDAVEVPTGGPGYDEIDKDTYDRLGGLQFRQRLPRQGCAVHLAGVAFEDRNAEFGRAVSTVYPGLTRLRYTIETRQRRFRLDKLVVRVSAEAEPAPLPAFVLIHRSDRLPLHVHDGTPLPVVPDSPQVSQPTRQFRPDRLPVDGSGLGWVAEVRGLVGYVRLFLDGPPAQLAQLALLDPPAASLQLRG